jgi:hypothetical protein
MGITVEAVEAATLRFVGTCPKLDREALAAIGIDLDAVLKGSQQAFGSHALDEPPSPEKSALNTSRSL